MKDLVFRPPFERAEAVRDGELAPTELVQSRPDRIDALNPPLSAFVVLRREEAPGAAAALRRPIVAGERFGPRAGLPIGGKDLGDDAGLAVRTWIVGPRFRDDLVLRGSYVRDQAPPWNGRRPELGA
ncbi:MAG: hypothetical protein IT293_11070 [Deltaproteobacteria bacterium]|nr:hypothetical protein [Deltaproteobacteria bacterium]